MALTLTPGQEMRLDGAPDQMLPPAQDKLQALAYRLLEEDEEGVLYGGDVRNAIPVANQMLMEGNTARLDAAVARGTARAGKRAEARQAARGVNPEALPADEYGSVSARTVKTANMSPDDQEASLMQYQDLADAEIRDMREGRFHGANAQARQFEQDYGLSTTPSATGKTDLDYLREIQRHQGFLRTGSGEMIPMGPTPTPEAIASRRGFNEWANETPGTERQALYDPQAYEEFREGVRNDIRDRAQDDMATYGTGVADPAVRADLGLPGLTPEQQAAREARARSEDRVRQAQRGRFYEEKLRAEAGLPAAPLPENPTVQDLERLAFRRRYDKRQADLAQRKQNRIDQAMLAGGQPTGGPFGTRATTTAINQLGPGWREIALLDRLTNGRVGGPTPLGVDAVGAQNALKFLNNEAMAGMDPLRRQMMEAQLDMQLRDNNPAIAGQNDVAEGNVQTPEAVQHLADLAERHDTTSGGFSYDDEMRLAQTLQRPPYNMSQADAEAKAYELAESRRWFNGGKPAGQQGVAPPPAAAPAPQAQPPAPDVPIRRTPQGGGRGGPVRNPLPMLPGGAGRGGSRTLPRNRR